MKREQILVAAVRTADAGKAPGQHATPVETLQCAWNRTPEGAVPASVPVVVHVKEGLGVMCDQLPEWTKSVPRKDPFRTPE